MSSEVVADVYAIRMGCGKAVIAAIGGIVDRGILRVMLDSFIAAIIYTMFVGSIFMGGWVVLMLVGAGTFVMAFGGAVFIMSYLLSYFGTGYSGLYNAGHRRFEDAIRQLIAKLREVKDMNLSEKKELLDDLEKFLRMNKELQPWYENTFIRRVMGWMVSGADFKKQEFEHFTQAIANSEINVLAERLKLIAKD